MPVKITKKSKKTKKGKVTQSQQVVVNINKGKRKASSQPVSRPSQAPIIIQQPQQDFSQLENLFKQYSTSRSVAEPVKKSITMGMDTQTDLTIPPDLEEKIKQDQEALQKKIEKLNEKKPVFMPESEISVPVKKRPVVIPLPVRANAPPPTPDKVYNPNSGRYVTPVYYKKLVREGKIKPE